MSPDFSTSWKRELYDSVFSNLPALKWQRERDMMYRAHLVLNFTGAVFLFRILPRNRLARQTTRSWNKFDRKHRRSHSNLTVSIGMFDLWMASGNDLEHREPAHVEAEFAVKAINQSKLTKYTIKLRTLVFFLSSVIVYFSTSSCAGLMIALLELNR